MLFATRNKESKRPAKAEPSNKSMPTAESKPMPKSKPPANAKPVKARPYINSKQTGEVVMAV
jgi:hypothetical protein